MKRSATSTTRITTIAYYSLFFIFIVCQAQVSAQCAADASICGNKCYDPKKYTCEKATLCAIGQLHCGENCYDAAAQWCNNGAVEAKPKCAYTWLSCGSKCYNPLVNSCTNNIICPKDHSLCGTSCYLPSVMKCFNNEAACMQGQVQCPGTKSCCTPAQAAAMVGRQEVLVFNEDFNTLDTSIWKHEITLSGGGNNEFQYNTNNRSISFAKDGILYIKPKLTEDVVGFSVTEPGRSLDIWGIMPPDQCTSNYNHGCLREVTSGYIINPVTSARMNTYPSFSFKYGRVEIKAKMPIGDYLWPALWLMPRDNQYGSWPSSGEIDIAESRGNLMYPNQEGASAVSSTLHWGPNSGPGGNGYMLTRTKKVMPDARALGDQFHTYGLYWDNSTLYTYLDNPANRILFVNFTVSSLWNMANSNGYGWYSKGFSNPWQTAAPSAPFDQQFYLLVSLAVGGSGGYWAEAPNKPWNDTSPFAITEFWQNKAKWMPSWVGEDIALKVDSIKVWGFSGISSFCSFGSCKKL